MKYVYVVVGVGGTGSLLARDLPKLMIGTMNKMILIDGDIVELKNMKRQSYQKHDIGLNKAVALSKKINTFYGSICDCIDAYVTKDEIIHRITHDYKGFIPVLIGCVDNDNTRALLENTFDQLKECIYLDSANSEYEGNVYVCAKIKNMKKGKLRSDVYELTEDIHPCEKSCQEQTANGNTQFLVTNMKMATVLFEHINSILINDVRIGVTNVKRFETIHY